MNFANKLKRLRKSAGFSQEKLAEKIGVSRQAITKWETENGIPDIENIIAISKFFNISIDELLLNEEMNKKKSEYLFESISEYDIDDTKHFDMKLGYAKSVFVNGYNGEKLYIRLVSNTLSTIEKYLKVKIDDIKKCIDVDINNFSDITKAKIKEELNIFVEIPNKYIKNIELSINSKDVELNSLQAENIELDIKTKNVYLKNVAGNIEINCNEDMQIECNFIKGQLSINQYSSTSTLFIPKELLFKSVKRGIGTKIYYEENGEKISDFSQKDSDNIIEFNGIKSELIISTKTNEDK